MKPTQQARDAAAAAPAASDSDSTGPPPSAMIAGDAVRGERLFGQVGCIGCHMVDGVGGIVGPDLTVLAARPSRDPVRWSSTEAYVRASIVQPNALVVPKYSPDMPSAESLGLGAQDVEDLAAYLMTLR